MNIVQSDTCGWEWHECGLEAYVLEMYTVATPFPGHKVMNTILWCHNPCTSQVRRILLNVCGYWRVADDEDKIMNDVRRKMKKEEGREG